MAVIIHLLEEVSRYSWREGRREGGREGGRVTYVSDPLAGEEGELEV